VNLAWIDLETLGTDEHTDPIVEVACIVTDLGLNEPSAASWTNGEATWVFDDVVKPDGWPRCALSAEVAKMHAATGLLNEIDDGRPIRHVDGELAGMLDHWTDGGRIALAGSGVAHFDGRFIRAQMPQTAKRLTYWAMDIGAVRRFATQVCGLDDRRLPDTTKTHRALDDIRHHLAEARAWRCELAEAEGASA